MTNSHCLELLSWLGTDNLKLLYTVDKAFKNTIQLFLLSLPFLYDGMLRHDYRNAWTISYLAYGVCCVDAMQNHAQTVICFSWHLLPGEGPGHRWTDWCRKLLPLRDRLDLQRGRLNCKRGNSMHNVQNVSNSGNTESSPWCIYSTHCKKDQMYVILRRKRKKLLSDLTDKITLEFLFWDSVFTRTSFMRDLTKPYDFTGR